jgi:hypothetical protein
MNQTNKKTLSKILIIFLVCSSLTLFFPNVLADTYPISITITDPTFTIYATGTIPIELSAASNGSETVLTYNVWAGAEWVGTNQTYTTATQLTDYTNGSYTLYVYAENSEGTTASETVAFIVSFVEPTATPAPTPGPTTDIEYTDKPATSIFYFIILCVALIVGAVLSYLIFPYLGIGVGVLGIMGTAYFANTGLLIVSQYTDVNTAITHIALMPIGWFIIAPIVLSILNFCIPLLKRR